MERFQGQSHPQGRKILLMLRRRRISQIPVKGRQKGSMLIESTARERGDVGDKRLNDRAQPRVRESKFLIDSFCPIGSRSQAFGPTRTLVRVKRKVKLWNRVKWFTRCC